MKGQTGKMPDTFGIFGKYDEISLKKCGFALAFCALFLYNEVIIGEEAAKAWEN